jgi:hypothetical protein
MTYYHAAQLFVLTRGSSGRMVRGIGTRENEMNMKEHIIAEFQYKQVCSVYDHLVVANFEAAAHGKMPPALVAALADLEARFGEYLDQQAEKFYTEA